MTLRRTSLARSLLASFCALVACAGTSDKAPDKALEKALAQLARLDPCARPESLQSRALWFSDAFYGMRGSTGGTLVALRPDSAAWTMTVEPVESDFPEESRSWPPAAAPESLTVRWRGAIGARGVVIPADTATQPGFRRVIYDSITFSASCARLSLLAWRGGSATDTVRLGRRDEGERRMYGRDDQE